MEKYKEVIWSIIPTSTPTVIRHCSKCRKNMPYYCSEKFRLNGNHNRINIWLIYKCTKCDNSWELTLMRDIVPKDIESQLFDRLTNNDKELAWKYAFDRSLLKQNKCDIDYSGIEYSVEGFDVRDIHMPLRVHLKSPYVFDLKLGAFLAERLGISIGNIKKYADRGLIATDLEFDIVKYRIKTDFTLLINLKCINQNENPC